MEKTPLAEVRCSRVVYACGRSQDKFTADQPPGLKLTGTPEGVVVEFPGMPDTLIYPANLLSSVALGNIGVVEQPKLHKLDPEKPAPKVEEKKPEEKKLSSFLKKK